MRTLKPEPLTREAFAPFGDVIEASNDAKRLVINYGTTTRFHDLAAIDVTGDSGKAGVSIFRSTPIVLPLAIVFMEYHPKSSQTFVPLSGNPYLVVVAPKGPFDVSKIRVFVASGDQGVNYHAGTWHHFSLALEGVSDFLVIDRIADDDNCVEHRLTADEEALISL